MEEGLHGGWLVKVDASGNMLWNRTIEQQESSIFSISQANDNQYVFSAKITNYVVWVSSIDNLGNLGYSEAKITAPNSFDALSPNAITSTSDGNYVFVGTWDNTSSAANSRMWLVKIDSAPFVSASPSQSPSGYPPLFPGEPFTQALFLAIVITIICLGLIVFLRKYRHRFKDK